MIDAAKTDAAFFHGLNLILERYCENRNLNEVLSGLPNKGDSISLGTLLRALDRAGISARVEKISLPRLARSAKPAILFLSGNNTALGLGPSHQGKQLTVLSLDGKATEKDIPLIKLKPLYLGYAVVIRPGEKTAQLPGGTLQGSRSHWFRRVIFKSWRIYRDVLIASFMINLFALASPLFIMNVYDRVVPNNALETLWVLMVGVLIIFAFDLVLRLLRGYFIDISGRRADIELSAILYQQVLGIRMADRPASVGAFASNLDEFESIRNFITSATVVTLIDLPFVFPFLFVIWFVGGSLVLIPLAAVPLILIYALVVQPAIRRAAQQAASGSAAKSATLVESLVGIETVKLLGAEGRQQHEWEQAVEHTSLWSIRSRLLSASVVNAAVFLQQMTTMGVVAYGVYLIAEGKLSLGGLIAAVILTSRVLAPMAQVANLATHYHRASGAMKTITSILNLPVERDPNKEYLVLPEIRGEVEFEKVTFSYPGQASPALDNVSLRIRPGERVGVIGRTGSGKSTLGRLIAGLYQENSGFVRVDGIDVRQLDPTELRDNIGYVPQDVILFSTSMRENILFGQPRATDDELIRAAKLSDAFSIIRSHPAGFDMPIGERGASLSGGQRQSVAIARAVLHDPPILILDEPSNSMDNVSETRLKRKLEPFLRNKTLVLITHKPSMLDLVERLVVIEHGRIVADGKKQEVIHALESLQKSA